MAIEQLDDGAVRIIRIRRPEARNAIDPEHARGLYDAFVAAEADTAVGAMVLSGTPQAFCAGFDLKALAGGRAQQWLEQLHFGRDGEPPLGPMGPTRLELSKPVIAAVEGPAVAGGLELACWADLRVLGQGAYLGVYCRRFGVPLIDGGTVRLPRIVGEGRAQELILTGRRVDAAECLQIGLANRVVADGQAEAVATAWAEELTRLPAVCLRADRLSAKRQWGDLQAALEQEFSGARHTLDTARAGAEGFAAGAGRHGAVLNGDEPAL